VKHFEALGLHRFGTVDANAALEWIAEGLQAAGLAVEAQRFPIERQHVLGSATMSVGGKTTSIVPQWWIPEDKASFTLSAPIARDGDAAGKFVRLKIPYDRGAYLDKKHRDAIAAASSGRPAAILLTIDHPSGELFTYNVSQADAAWNVPVLLVAPKDQPPLEEAERTDTPVTVTVKGRYERNVLAATAQNHLKHVQATWLVGDRAAGELRDIKGAGYPNFLGMFGLHPLFHTPLDNAEMTGPAVLEPVMRGFVATLQDMIAKQDQLKR